MLNFIIRNARRFKVVRPTEFLLKLFFWPNIIRKNYRDIKDVKARLYTINQDVESSCIYNNNIIKDTQFDLQIIVPVYNVERYLKECLNSIISQEKGDYKVLTVVINDGSPDNSAKILEDYANIDNFLIINQSNRGHSGARNTGLSTIYADYIMFVDSDDMLPHNCLKRMLDTAKTTDSDIVQGSYEEFYDNGYCSIITNDRLKGFPWGRIYKSSLFSQLHFPEKYWFEDTFNHFLIHGYISEEKMVFTKDIVYRYRINPNGISKTSKGNPKILDSLYITNSILLDIDKLNLSFEKVHTQLLIQIFTNYYRIASLKSEKVNRLVFMYTCDMYKKYYGGIPIHTNNSNLIKLSNALKQYDYKEYILTMLTYNL